MKNYIVNSIDFDLDPGDDSIPQHIQDQVQLELNQEYVNTQWMVEDDEDLVNEISNQSGWCIKSISYDVVEEC